MPPAPLGVSHSTATLEAAAPAVKFNDFNTFGYDNQRDGFNPNSTAITPASAVKLHLAWQTVMGTGGGDYNVQSQPILATEIPNHAGVLFVAGESGYVDAQDALTGNNIWSVSTGQETYNCGGGAAQFGAGGTVAYDPQSTSLYVAANNGGGGVASQNLLVHLGGATGARLGSYNFGQTLTAHELNFSHTSVALSNGIAYVGTGSTCDISSWRGRIAAVSVPAMQPVNTYFTNWSPTRQWSGGGVWGWGGVALDFSGDILAGIGNTDNGQNGQLFSPFVAAPQEYSGNGESLVKLTHNLAKELASDHPIPHGLYGGQKVDLDVNGTPVVFKPLGTGCDPMIALQSKAGTLLLYDGTNIPAGPRAQYQFAPAGYSDGFLGVPAYSQSNGLLYSVVASDQSPTFFAPGMVAINPGCGSPSVTWRAAFGPDGTKAGLPRSVPAVSAGGVVYVATSCNGNSGLCPTVGTGGAVWELDAASGQILNGGTPVLYTPAPVRAPATIDGNWVFIVDMQGDLYGLTIDPKYAKVAAKWRPVDSRIFSRRYARPMEQ